MATVVVGALVFAGIGLAGYATYRSRKKSPCGGCSGCAGGGKDSQNCCH